MAALPFFFFFLGLLAAHLSAARAATCHPEDRSALLQFRSSLRESDTGVFSTWTPAADCCSKWKGVSCDPTTGRVADISLHGAATDLAPASADKPRVMTGTLSPAVCRLPHLSSLILAEWKQISGPIPACIPSSLPFLRHLDLIGNAFSGAVPQDVGRLSNLTVLNLADNQLSGGVPASLTRLSDLRHLDLSGNRLSGPLPSNFGHIKMLSRALLARNQLTGQIPQSVTSLKRLADLDLSSNKISGRLPGRMGLMPVLSTLNLDGNQITGGIPTSLLASRGLGILNMSRNALEGPIPDAFGERSYFMMLDLSYNRLTGRVPKTLTAAAYVGHLDLSHNHLCGPIPAGAPFDHLEAASFASNDCLCGAPLPPCK